MSGGYVLHEAERLVPSRSRPARVARALGLVLIAFVVFALLAPWRQNVSGSGQVVAYVPDERLQAIQAPVAGRIVRWLVREGVHVEADQPLVELTDNDPRLVERLGTERDASAEKLGSYEQRLSSLSQQIDAAIAARRGDVAGAQAKLTGAGQKLTASEQKLQAAEANLETTVLQLGRVKALAERGLTAQRELELAELSGVKARTERDGATAEVLLARAELEAARAALDKARAEGDAKVQETEAKRSSGESDAADARASLTRLDVSITRQSNQLVRAARAGVIWRVIARQGGEQVKQGDTLAYLVPHATLRAVQLWVDGNDAAILSEGRKVRLQFEGWPAVQFAGWPSVAVGSFGGVISFIDPQDDGMGDFRIVVLPDKTDQPWPSPPFLRQGVRAKGWVLLEEVSIGFELWRRFNGFPPTLRKRPEYLVGEGKAAEDKP